MNPRTLWSADEVNKPKSAHHAPELAPWALFAPSTHHSGLVKLTK